MRAFGRFIRRSLFLAVIAFVAAAALGLVIVKFNRPKQRNYPAEIASQTVNAVDQRSYDNMQGAISDFNKGEFTDQAIENLGNIYKARQAQMNKIRHMVNGTEQVREAINLSVLNGLPATPKNPLAACETISEGLRRCIWATKSADWVPVMLQAGETLTADPEGRVADTKLTKYGAMTPAGLNYLCPNLTLRQTLPVPNAPPYALVAKLAGGPATALAGRYGKPLQASEPVTAYLRVNMVPPTQTIAGTESLEGSFPVLIKTDP